MGGGEWIEPRRREGPGEDRTASGMMGSFIPSWFLVPGYGLRKRPGAVTRLALRALALLGKRMAVIEQANESCLEAVEGILRECVASMRVAGIEQWDEIYPTADYFRRDWEGGNLFVMRDGESRVVGCAGLDERQSPEYESVGWTHKVERIGVVHRLMISPEQQGKGYAKVLMRGLEEEGRRRGYQAIRLDAFVLNPASLRLYAGLGYVQCGQVRFRKGEFACFEKLLG